MPELSKTAKASMGKQYKEVHVETTEQLFEPSESIGKPGCLSGICPESISFFTPTIML